MKPHKAKADFIKYRAEGRSYSYIAKALNISKSTCTAWERELKETIADLKQEQLNELYDSYYMKKEARIKRLGETLNNINEALEKADLTELSPDKLLDFKLKYTEALKEEYSGLLTPFQFTDSAEPQEIIEALSDLLNRVRAGDISAEQASRESTVISNLLKAYEQIEIKDKIETLEAIIGGRQQWQRA